MTSRARAFAERAAGLSLLVSVAGCGGDDFEVAQCDASVAGTYRLTYTEQRNTCSGSPGVTMITLVIGQSGSAYSFDYFYTEPENETCDVSVSGCRVSATCDLSLPDAATTITSDVSYDVREAGLSGNETWTVRDRMTGAQCTLEYSVDGPRN